MNTAIASIWLVSSFRMRFQQKLIYLIFISFGLYAKSSKAATGCVEKPTIQNGDIASYSFYKDNSYSWVKFRCNDGTTPPNATINCQMGTKTWPAFRPFCYGPCSNNFPEMPGGLVCSWRYVAGKPDVRTSLTYCCSDTTMEIVGDKVSTCRNGNWTPIGTCGTPETNPCMDRLRPAAPFSNPTRGAKSRYARGSLTRADSPNLLRMVPVPKDLVIQRHTCWRNNVDPPAKSMPAIKWDDEVAWLAERWAATCPKGGSPLTAHDRNEDRIIPGRTFQGGQTWIGQNAYFSTGNSSWLNAIDAWASERHDWTYGSSESSSGNEIGHYTQMVSSNIYLIGCAHIECNDGLKMYCNYAVGGNIGDDGIAQPYEKVDDK